MPTKKKRVGFIPREDVLRIIDKLSIDHNLSNSKIINILVEEALSARGILNKNNGKLSQSYKFSKDKSQNYYDGPLDFLNNSEQSIETNLGNQFNTSKPTNLSEANLEPFDQQTYTKFLLFLKFQEMMNKYNS